MKTAGMIPMSTVDFPGHLAAVVFTAGCDLDCFFCHNRPLLGAQAPDLPLAEVLAFLDKRRGKLDGVVVSGGEPTLQPGLADFLRTVRAMGYATKLDTHGGHPEILASLLRARPHPLLDYVAVDFKVPWDRYPDVCGCGPQVATAVRKSIALLDKGSSTGRLAWEVRTTVIPQITEDDLVAMASSLPQVPLYALQMYRVPTDHLPQDRFRIHAAAMTRTQLEHAATRMSAFQPHVTIRA